MGGPGGGGRGPGPSLMAPSSGGGRGPRLATPVARAWSLARQGRAEPVGPPGLTSVQLSRVRLRGCGSDFQVRVGDAGVSETLAHTAGGVARAATCPPARAPPPQGRGALRQHGRSPPSSAVYGHRRPSAMATRRPPRAGRWRRPGGSPGARQAMGTGLRGHAHTCQLSVVICRGGVPAWAGTATVRERSGRSGVGGPHALAAPRAPCGGSWGVRTPDLGTAARCAGQRREPVDDVMAAGPGGRGRRRQQPKAGSAACSPGPCPSRDRRGGRAHGGTPPGTEATEGAHASAWSTTWAASGPGARLRPTRGAAGPADASRSPGLSVQAQRPAASPSPAHTVPLPRVLVAACLARVPAARPAALHAA